MFVRQILTFCSQSRNLYTALPGTPYALTGPEFPGSDPFYVDHESNGIKELEKRSLDKGLQRLN